MRHAPPTKLPREPTVSEWCASFATVPAGKPTCAVCERPVDKIVWYEDVITREHVAVAFCHGEREEVSLTQGELHVLTSLQVGRAFESKPQLAAPGLPQPQSTS